MLIDSDNSFWDVLVRLVRQRTGQLFTPRSVPPTTLTPGASVDDVLLTSSGELAVWGTNPASTALAAHLADPTDAHDAAAISYAGGTGIAATDVEAAVDELANEKLNISAKHGYCLMGFAASFNPADGANYYVGGTPAATWSTSSTAGRIYVPVAGTVVAAHVRFVATVAGSSENITCHLVKNGTTAEAIETLGASAAERVFNNEALSTAVAVGDYISIRFEMPTWATDPTGVSVCASIYIEPS